VNVAAVIFNWACLAVAVIVLGWSLTMAPRTRSSKAPFQWFLAGCVIEEGAELVNLYTRASWAPYLFWLGGPFLVAGLYATILELNRWNRGDQPERVDD
jgi:hypothetical protein